MPGSWENWEFDDATGQWSWDTERVSGELFYARLCITPDRRIVWEQNGVVIWEQHRPAYDTLPIEELKWVAVSAVQTWAWHIAHKAGSASLNIPYIFMGPRPGGDPERWINFFGIDVISVFGFKVVIREGNHLGERNPDGSWSSVYFPQWVLFEGSNFPGGQYVTLGKIPPEFSPEERRAYALREAASYLQKAVNEMYVQASTSPTSGMAPPTEFDHARQSLHMEPFRSLRLQPLTGSSDEESVEESVGTEPGRSRFSVIDED